MAHMTLPVAKKSKVWQTDQIPVWPNPMRCDDQSTNELLFWDPPVQQVQKLMDVQDDGAVAKHRITAINCRAVGALCPRLSSGQQCSVICILKLPTAASGAQTSQH